MKEKIVLLIAIGAGIVAAFLTRLYLVAKDAEVESLKARFVATHGVMKALCYKTDVPGGTTLRDEHIGTIVVPITGMRGQALGLENLRDVVGRKILFGHRKGDIVFWADIEGGNPADQGLSTAVKSSRRAVSVSVSGAAAVSCLVKPNDHVDVIGTFVFPDSTGRISPNEAKTCTILQNVLVLATGRETVKTPVGAKFGITAAQPYATVTLEVSPREAEMLAFAEQAKGRLTLSLRNRNDIYFEKELPMVDFKKILSQIEELNLARQQKVVR